MRLLVGFVKPTEVEAAFAFKKYFSDSGKLYSVEYILASVHRLSTPWALPYNSKLYSVEYILECPQVVHPVGSTRISADGNLASKLARLAGEADSIRWEVEISTHDRDKKTGIDPVHLNNSHSKVLYLETVGLIDETPIIYISVLTYITRRGRPR